MVANLAQYIPIYLPFPYPVRRVFWSTSTAATTSMHCDVGVYTWTGGVRLFSVGSTAISAASTVQYASLSSDIVLAPGPYWMAFVVDSATANVIRGLAATTSNPGKVMGCVQQASALPLPSTLTAAAWAQTGWSLPYFGITRTSSGF